MSLLAFADAVDIGGGRGRLSAPAAASLARVDRAFGRAADVNEAWRSPEQADKNYRAYVAYRAYLAGLGPKVPWAALAYPADTSIHCRGYALDTDDTSTAQMRIWNDHGWFWTVYRNGVLIERWHLEYDTRRDNRRNDPAPAGNASTPPVSEEDDDMPGPNKKLVLWNEQHYFLIGEETFYHVVNIGWLAYLRDHYGPHGQAQEIDNDALNLELVTNAIPWGAVDACMRGIAFGDDRRSWSRLQAEGDAIRGQQAASRKTIDDVLATAKRIEQGG